MYVEYISDHNHPTRRIIHVYACEKYTHTITNQTKFSIFQRVQHVHCWLCVSVYVCVWVGWAVGQTIKNPFFNTGVVQSHKEVCQGV